MLKTKNEGYTIEKVCEVADSVTFVLGAMRIDDEEGNFLRNQYVTWEYRKECGFYWGHYFGDYKEAFADFYCRIKNEAETIEHWYREQMKLPY